MSDEKDLDLVLGNEEKMEEVEKKEVKLPDAPKSKADQIMASNMSQSQKEKYLRQLGFSGDSGEKQDGKVVPFTVYAKIRKIKPELHEAMLVYPKAVGLKAATVKEWDEVFKDF